MGKSEISYKSKNPFFPLLNALISKSLGGILMYSQSLSDKSVFRISKNCKWGKLQGGQNPLFTPKNEFLTLLGPPCRFPHEILRYSEDTFIRQTL